MKRSARCSRHARNNPQDQRVEPSASAAKSAKLRKACEVALGSFVNVVPFGSTNSAAVRIDPVDSERAGASDPGQDARAPGEGKKEFCS